ncbi:MAG: hypothetical protein WBD55_08000 [Dehalococcoidia bacterium]
MEWNRDHVRHLAMRLAVAFVLAYFGLQELHNPSDWKVFVPHIIAHRAPGGANDLVIVHGFLLVLASVTVATGILYIVGVVLAFGMLGEVCLGLWLDSGFTDLLVRDIGLFGLAVALAVDPVHAWRLDSAIVAKFRSLRQPLTQQRRPLQAPDARSLTWSVRAASGGALLGGLLLVTLVLRVTGGGTPAATNVASVYHTQPTPSTAVQSTLDPAQSTPPNTSPQPTAPAATASAPPANATRFDDWPYHDASFQVYPGPIGSDARKALAGFDLTVQDQGPSVTLVFKALSSRYQDATVSVPKGNTAYFIETTMRDDPSPQEDNELNDDGVIIVNPQGYIVQS